MSLLKKQNWLSLLLLSIFSFGAINTVLAYMLGLFDKEAWYYNKKYWIGALVTLIFPIFIMAIIFVIQMNCKLCTKLKVSGQSIYNNVYIWIGALCIPVIGWIIDIVLLIYITVWPSVMAKTGSCERFIK